MTFAASSPSRKSCLKLLALAALALAGCSHARDRETTHRALSPLNSRFEWGVQHFEAGDYPKAIATFESLRKEGASVKEFGLIDFYVGMSHFRLKEYPQAAAELETFARSHTSFEEDQEARIALLLVYEKLGRWKDIAGLAAESDKLTLFQNNRALLKLVWARALREQGELMGAKGELEEALPFLDKMDDDGGRPFYADPDQDLWGRYHYTDVLVTEADCAGLLPKDIAPQPKPGAKKKDGNPLPKPRPRMLYTPWLEARVDCQRKAILGASQDLFPLESPWTEPTMAALMQGNTQLSDEVHAYLKREAPTLDRSRALQKVARENFYRLLATIEEQMKDFKKRSLSDAPLESLRKQVDRLLVALSSPS